MTELLSKNRYGQRVYQGILPPWWDTVDVTYPDATTEVYTYSVKNEGDVLEIQAIINVLYTDTSKSDILQVKKVYHAPGAY